ncbi:hypothetical protein Bealeia1_02044 (plasmid) [Candidatus Bealeia paramacronuclearis]|uniref:Uncharacterized protein n=1 Tax=Candidatus Bealeia paramacronuclearis TaxID=1921001 RepID=A0ABZ2C5X9_9PROT
MRLRRFLNLIRLQPYFVLCDSLELAEISVKSRRQIKVQIRLACDNIVFSMTQNI